MSIFRIALDLDLLSFFDKFRNELGHSSVECPYEEETKTEKM